MTYAFVLAAGIINVISQGPRLTPEEAAAILRPYASVVTVPAPTRPNVVILTRPAPAPAPRPALRPPLNGLNVFVHEHSAVSVRIVK